LFLEYFEDTLLILTVHIDTRQALLLGLEYAATSSFL